MLILPGFAAASEDRSSGGFTTSKTIQPSRGGSTLLALGEPLGYVYCQPYQASSSEQYL